MRRNSCPLFLEIRHSGTIVLALHERWTYYNLGIQFYNDDNNTPNSVITDRQRELRKESGQT